MFSGRNIAREAKAYEMAGTFSRFEELNEITTVTRSFNVLGSVHGDEAPCRSLFDELKFVINIVKRLLLAHFLYFRFVSPRSGE